MDRTEVRMSGFGGQGIILAGFILGQAVSIFEGKNATLTQDYGPEARGGSCSAQVVISDRPGSYPYVEDPSVQVVMSQDAYARYGANLRDDALLIIDEDLVKPKKAQKGMVLSVPATRIAQDLGRRAVANIVMLGYLAAVTGVVALDAMKRSVLASVPKGSEELNMTALERGYAWGREGQGSEEGREG